MVRRQEEYKLRFVKISSRIEKWIVTFIIASTITLVIGQSLYSFDLIRHFFVETEDLEGKAQTP